MLYSTSKRYSIHRGETEDDFVDRYRSEAFGVADFLQKHATLQSSVFSPVYNRRMKVHRTEVTHYFDLIGRNDTPMAAFVIADFLALKGYAIPHD